MADIEQLLATYRAQQHELDVQIAVLQARQIAIAGFIERLERQPPKRKHRRTKPVPAVSAAMSQAHPQDHILLTNTEAA